MLTLIVHVNLTFLKNRTKLR